MSSEASFLTPLFPRCIYNYGSTSTWVIAPPPCSAARGCTVRGGGRRCGASRAPQHSSSRLGAGARKWQQRPPRHLSRGALEAPAAAGAAWCGAAAAPPSPGAPAGPHKVCSQRPCTAELPERCCGPALCVRGDGPRPMLHGQTGACRENFEKLPRRNLRLQLASRGPGEELV